MTNATRKTFLNLYSQRLTRIDTSDMANVITNYDAITPYVFDFNGAWIGIGNGLLTYENPSQCYLDIYEVSAGTEYLLTLGSNVGTRFRVMFTTTDVSTGTSGTVQGVAVNSFSGSPSAYEHLSYTPTSNGYLVVQKDNAGATGIATYLYETVILSDTPSLLCCVSEIDTAKITSSKVSAIINALTPCLTLSEQITAKTIEGYKVVS